MTMTKKYLPYKIRKTLQEEDLKKFKYVENKLLKKNLEINWRHITFLLALEKEYKIPRPAAITINKTIIIYLGSIIECLLAYKLQKLIKTKKYKRADILKPFKKFKNLGKLYQISEHASVCGALKTLYFKDFSDINFYHLNLAAKKAGLFNTNLYRKAEKLRKIRNKIHLSNLQAEDDQYSKPEMEHFFNLAHGIISGLVEN